ncbi:MAG TPA: hypothetical protein DEV78_04000 [Clostridiales bacterium]|nr:hypothetical protein [Clostridiales bacterium]
MTKRNQEISSGANSNNYQGENLTIVHNHITQFDEEKAKQISEYSAKQIMEEYFSNADELAQKRMNDFENRFIPKLAEIENALEIFNDPAFKLVYRKAQIQAATTTRESDYNILSELLIHRYKKQNNKASCIGINGAVDIVEQISDESLVALTVITTILIGICPITGNITEGLNVMNKLFESLLICDLPNNNDWLDQLDILKAIRLNSFCRLKKLKEFYLQNLDGYFCVGIDKNSENYQKAINLLKPYGLENILIDHELIDNHVRLPLTKTTEIDKLDKIQSNGTILPLSQEEKECLYKVIDFYDKVADKKNIVLNKFYEKLDTFPALKVIHDWWDKIPNGFSITSIGRVLGHANAQKCYTGFPPLD